MLPVDTLVAGRVTVDGTDGQLEPEGIDDSWGVPWLSSSLNDGLAWDSLVLTWRCVISQALRTQALVAKLQFRVLADRWRDETLFESSIDRIISHPAYLQIVAMGSSAVPLILAELKEAPALWFWALSAITGKSPEPEGSQGDIGAMTKAWLDWGKSKHLV